MSYTSLRSKIHVYQVQGEDRDYEAVTDDDTGFQGVQAKQLSGPRLDIRVSEIRFSFSGGQSDWPKHPCRKHVVFYDPAGAKYPEPMQEIRTGGAEIEIFKRHGKPGALGFFISDTGIVSLP